MSLESEIRLGMRIILVALGGFFLWAGTAPLDEGIPAPGVLAVESKRKQVAHLSGGIVGKILVKDGQRVRAGDELIKLDATQANAALRTAEQRWWTALATAARLQAEAAGAAGITWPRELQMRRGESTIDAIVATQQDVFRTGRTASAGEIGIIREAQRGLEIQLHSLDALKASRERQVTLFTEQVASAKTLREQGYVSRNQALDIERQLAEIQSRQSEDLANISAVNARLADLRMRETQYRVNQRREAEAALADVRNDLGSLGQQVAALRDTHDRLAVRAPVSGTVVDLAVTTLGGVVKPGDRLLDIVPDEEDLIVEARLDPRYIDRVHPGLPAELRLDAYLNRAMGPLVAGEVRLVSADAIRDERTGAVFYSLQVTIPAAQRARLGAARLQSGMLCSVMIKTGERTLLTYLTRPLVRRFSDSLTET